MRLATFLPPGESDPVAGEVRGEEVVAFSNGTSVRDRLASGDRSPADGASYSLSDVTLLAPMDTVMVPAVVGVTLICQVLRSPLGLYTFAIAPVDAVPVTVTEALPNPLIGSLKIAVK